MKKESISLQKLKNRYLKAVKFNYDISSDDIKLTKDVINFIKEKQLIGLKYNTYNKCYYITNKKLKLWNGNILFWETKSIS